jgi:hypothetical protein
LDDGLFVFRNKNLLQDEQNTRRSTILSSKTKIMASPSRPEIPSSFRFEFDSANKILVGRVEGRLTDESLAEIYSEIRRYAIATDATAGILDMSSVTEFAMSAECVRRLASQEPAMPDATRPRIVAVADPTGFGLARMFQILGEHTRPLLKIVHTLDEALEILGVQSLHFEPLERPHETALWHLRT